MADLRRLRSVWAGMLQRCTNPKAANYAYYGGRGIVVCPRWTVFEVFVKDMGARPAGTSLDRVDNDGNYEPGNCVWATRSEQMRNTRRRVVAGQRFGKLTAVEPARAGKNTHTRWLCRCDCGGTSIVYATNLRRNHTKSCGCAQGRPGLPRPTTTTRSSK